MLLLDSAIQIAAGNAGRIAPARTGFVLAEGSAVSAVIITINASQGRSQCRNLGLCFSCTTFSSSFREYLLREWGKGCSKTFANQHLPTNCISCTRHITNPCLFSRN